MKIIAELRFHGPSSINLDHDFFCPSDRVRNGADRRRNSLPAVVLSKLACGENTGSNEENPLASLFHLRILAVFAFYLPQHCASLFSIN